MATIVAEPLLSPPITEPSAATSITLRLAPLVNLDADQFYQFAAQNPELRLEQSSTGEIEIMAPTGGETGFRNMGISAQLYAWSQEQGGGKSFDSSTAFLLPNDATRSPDAAWVELSRWQKLTPKQRMQFPPLCPDFVLELRSESDRLTVLQAKMVEYLANGARLGWLVDPVEKKVHVYFPGKEPEIFQNPASVSGDPVLPGFVLALATIFTDETQA